MASTYTYDLRVDINDEKGHLRVENYHFGVFDFLHEKEIERFEADLHRSDLLETIKKEGTCQM